MAYTEFEEKRLVELQEEIEGRKEHVYSAPSYKDVPALKEIASIVEKRLSAEADADKETLLDSIYVLKYLSQSYESIGRPSVGVMFCKKALKLAVAAHKKYCVKAEDLGEMLYDAMKARNVYVDDDCEDLVEICSVVLPADEVDEIACSVKKHRRSIKLDAVEMTEKYLAVIDEVEKKIEENSEMCGRGSCFETWSLKRSYLAAYGIVWRSPAVLNPHIIFD